MCANLDKGEPVEIGNMSREWKDSEAAVSDGDLYRCLKGDTGRSAIQISVAIDGMVVSTKKNGVASRCIEMLGGLSVDQVRTKENSILYVPETVKR